MITTAIYLTFRISLLAVFTFLFVVLYEHGPENYLENVQKDALALVQKAARQTPEKSAHSGT